MELRKSFIWMVGKQFISLAKCSLFIYLIIVYLSRCSPVEEVLMMEDFEGAISSPFDEHDILEFQGNKILGNFNNQRIALRFENINNHREVNISLDLYIHDSWDGNTSGVNGPDIWSIAVGKNAGKVDEIHTSFSNSSCNTTICLLQSFPQPFPYPNDPKTGVSRFLPGLCHFQSRSDGTALYRINYTFRHSASRLYISMYDNLVQTNSYSRKCDESWSIDNIVVSLE